jgi:hypothetical protein
MDEVTECLLLESKLVRVLKCHDQMAGCPSIAGPDL